MRVFVLMSVCSIGNHACVSVINNFVPRGAIDYYTVPQGLDKEPRLPPFLAAPLHKFVMQVITTMYSYHLVPHSKRMWFHEYGSSQVHQFRPCGRSQILSFTCR